MKRLTVPAKLAGQRADKIITQLLGDVPRAEVQRWIADGNVTVDGAAISKKASLAAGTIIEVEPSAPLLSEAVPDPSVPFEVIHEDDHLIIVDKPAGVVVHPARGHRTGTLVNGLLARGGFDRKNADPRDSDGHLRPGIVHRIDKETSGLMVVAKTPACREGLKALFAAHDIARAYLAIVIGRARKARYDTPHGRHPKSRKRFTSLRGDKRAITMVTPIALYESASLVRCELETGRTHQIRVHLSEQGKTPIIGDKLYGRARSDIIDRQALHATVLGFVHPISGESLYFERELPDDMSEAITRLTT